MSNEKYAFLMLLSIYRGTFSQVNNMFAFLSYATCEWPEVKVMFCSVLLPTGLGIELEYTTKKKKKKKNDVHNQHIATTVVA